MTTTLPIWDLPALAAFRENVLNREIEAINTGWEDTLIPLGLVLAGRDFADDAMLNWVENWVEYHLAVPPQSPSPQEFRSQSSGDRNQGIYLTQYCGEWGSCMVFAELYQERESERLLSTVRQMADHICDNSIRVGDGVIAHAHWSQIPWVDTLYYTAAPLARAYHITGEKRYAEEAIKQCLLHAQYLRDQRTGCFFHEADPETGESASWFWARGNGWVIMAFADTLRYCPDDLPGWSDVLEIYRSLAVGLLRTQHSCGLWRIVPENDESHLETSGSIMIATGITVGVEAGWINRSLAAYALRTWWESMTWISSDGRLWGCQTPAGAGGWDTHKRSRIGTRTYGDGSLLRFAADLRRTGLA